MERAEPAVLTDSLSLGNFEASRSELTPLSPITITYQRSKFANTLISLPLLTSN